MNKKNLFAGLIGLILGAVFTFIVSNPSVSDINNAKGTMGKKAELSKPCKVYKVDDWIQSQCNLNPDQNCSYTTSQGCEYILRNVGGISILKGNSARIMFEITSDNGTQYIELAVPMD